jgi:hypothetical protein
MNAMTLYSQQVAGDMTGEVSNGWRLPPVKLDQRPSIESSRDFSFQQTVGTVYTRKEAAVAER